MKHRDDLWEEWIHGYVIQKTKIGSKDLIKSSSSEDRIL